MFFFILNFLNKLICSIFPEKCFHFDRTFKKIPNRSDNLLKYKYKELNLAANSQSVVIYQCADKLARLTLLQEYFVHDNTLTCDNPLALYREERRKNSNGSFIKERERVFRVCISCT